MSNLFVLGLIFEDWMWFYVVERKSH